MRFPLCVSCSSAHLRSQSSDSHTTLHRPHANTSRTMCCSRFVRDDFILCGCSYHLPETLVECGKAHCRFSKHHNPSCVEPECRRTCIQYRTHPEKYTRTINQICPMHRGIEGPAYY